jgi:hypothetical protein
MRCCKYTERADRKFADELASQPRRIQGSCLEAAANK